MVVVSFFHDGPLFKDHNGKFHNGVLNDKIIDRYFFFGDRFVSVTRVKEIDNASPDTVISHHNVEFVEVPNMNTIKGRLTAKGKCRDIIRSQVKASDFVVARVPSFAGEMALAEAKKQNKPVLAEVVGCPWDSLRMHSWKGKILAPKAALGLKRALKDAPFVVYVTNEFLQSRYPTSGRSIGCSDVVLAEVNEEMLAGRLKKIAESGKRIVLGTCGILNVKYKGQEHVIKGLAALKSDGYDVEYQLVGQGDASRLMQIAREYGVADCVNVIGTLSHDKVFEWLDSLDIYVQPSDTEGLCRALLEAMSRGCPCIASNAGGNPELINPEFVFKKKNVDGFVAAFKKLADDRAIRAKESAENFEKAKEYRLEILENKRNDFYKEVMGKV